MPPRALAVVREVLESHRMPWSVVVGPSRVGPVVHARQHLMHALAALETCPVKFSRMRVFSQPTIGRWMNRDASTVCSGIQAHAARLRERENGGGAFSA